MDVRPPGHDGDHDLPRLGLPGGIHPALAGLLGSWRGTTEFASGPWGPARTVDAEVTYRRAAGGFAVVQSYRHVEADGSHFEGHGMFTLDPDHSDVFWYYVDSTGASPGTPTRCTWHDGVLRVERHAGAGWTRHSISLRHATPPTAGSPDVPVSGEALLHVTELRIASLSDASDASTAGANGKRPAYALVMTSTFRRS
ncbi:DUF1579 family protein [Pseudarthrobacter equi]|uniref:DUF1579 family protein n=1 Tax=Pseudarthrobacter equi TaxID=728066 RepID=UPI0028D51D20|nr:DUF1579 family protein [Pseudarthrobacter equi]